MTPQRITNRGRLEGRPLFILAVLAATLIGCTLPREPGSLWWDIDVVVPLGVRTYSVWHMTDTTDADVRGQRSGIGLAEDSSVFFALWSEATVSVRDCLYFAPIEFAIEKDVNALFIPMDVDRAVTGTLGSMNAAVGALHGTVQDLESHGLVYRTGFAIDESIDSMTVDSGSVSLLIVNRLPYPISNIGVGFDEGDGPARLVGGFGGTMEPNTQIPVTGNLADVPFSRETHVSVTAIGEGGTQIEIDSTDFISVGLLIDTVTAAPYYGRIPAQLIAADSARPTDQQHTIRVATVGSGSLSIRLSNETGFADTLTMILPDVVSRLGDSLVITRHVPPGSEDTSLVNLEGWQLRMQPGDPQMLRGQVISISQATPDRREFLAGTDRVAGRVSISHLDFEFFDGTFHEMLLPIDAEAISVERPPEGWDAVHPLYVDATVLIEEAFGGTANLDLGVATYLAGSQIAAEQFVVENVDLSADSSVLIEDLDPLFVEFPDSADVNGTMSLSGDVAIFNNSIIDLAVQLKSPLYFTLDNLNPPGTIERIDTGDLRDIQAGTAEIKIWNHLPVGGRAFVVAARDSAALDPHSGATVDTVAVVDIPRPIVENGRAIDLTTAETSVTLSDSLLSYFQNPPFFTRTDLSIPGSEGDTLIVHGTDYLKIQVLARLVYEVRTGEIE